MDQIDYSSEEEAGRYTVGTSLSLDRGRREAEHVQGRSLTIPAFRDFQDSMMALNQI